MSNLREYLETALGAANVHEEPLPDAVLPSSCEQYPYESLEICGIQFVFIHWTDMMSVHQYELLRPVIEGAFGLPLVVVLDWPNPDRSAKLAKRRIMFVETGKQVYIPAYGMILKNTAAAMPEAVVRFTPQAQLCALYFLYADETAHSAADVMKRTGLNSMAVSRGLNALSSLGVIRSERAGNRKGYIICSDKGAFYRGVESCLINPVRKQVFISDRYIAENWVLAGYSALSQWSMIADDDRITYAITDTEYKKVSRHARQITGKLI